MLGLIGHSSNIIRRGSLNISVKILIFNDKFTVWYICEIPFGIPVDELELGARWTEKAHFGPR